MRDFLLFVCVVTMILQGAVISKAQPDIAVYDVGALFAEIDHKLDRVLDARLGDFNGDGVCNMLDRDGFLEAVYRSVADQEALEP
ncbi:MAG: hypothetical protein V3V96_16455 [Acidiferrobacterales bacterium]